MNKLEKNLYKDIYAENVYLIILYKTDKFFLRYVLFKRSLDAQFKELNKIQQAIDFIDIELNALPSILVFSKHFFNLLIAILIACIGTILSKISKQQLILISYSLVVILLFLSSMIGNYKTRKMKLKRDVCKIKISTKIYSLPGAVPMCEPTSIVLYKGLD